MIQDPTQGLLLLMGKYGLDLQDIKWDGRIHRFPGKDKKKSNRSGWYRAFDDHKGAVFGDYSSMGEQHVHWMADRSSEPTVEERARWREKERKRKKQKEKEIAVATEALRAVWKNAVKHEETVLKHPYLKRKEIEGAKGLRVSRKTDISAITGKENDVVPAGLLLVPMRRSRELMDLQRIWPDGKKRFFPGADPKGCVCMVGGNLWNAETNRRVYVTESWANARTISDATRCCAVVAFSAHALPAIAALVRRKYPKAEIIVAADNDRWSTIATRDDHEDIPNPGVHYAKQAEEEVEGVRVAIPQFTDLSKKPTDFDDLRMQEGMEKVRQWLDPDSAGEAVTEPSKLEETDPHEAPVPKWVEDAPFRCLGQDEGTNYFLSTTGQVRGLPDTNMGSRTLLALASEEFWLQHFDSKRGVRWNSANSAVNRCQEAVGVFRPDWVYSRGLWRDENKQVVIHMGDRLMPSGSKKWMAPEEYRDGNTIYHRRPRLAGPSSTHAMTVEEAGPIIDIFTDLPWTANGMGLLALGWTVIAPACGALLEWRPHLELVGAKASGKTKVLQKIIQPLLGDMYVGAQGMSTEAGIRQYLRGDALPVVCDEAGDPSSTKAAAIMRGRLDLARSASSPSGGTLKGTQTGTAIAHNCNSMFLFASIAPVPVDPSDVSRFVHTQLKSPRMMDPRKRREDWIALQKRIRQHVTPVAVGRQLLARTFRSFRSGHFDKLWDICTDAANQVFEDARMGDQYGPLAAGVWSLMTDELPPLNEVTDWFGIYNWGTSGEAETEDEGLKIIDKLLQARELIQFDRGGPHKLTIGDLIDIAREGPSVDPTRKELARKDLRQLGIAISKNDDGLLIANQSEWVKHQLRETPYANGWRNLIRTIPGAKVGPQTRFHTRLVNGRTTFIPFSAIAGEEKPQEEENG